MKPDPHFSAKLASITAQTELDGFLEGIQSRDATQEQIQAIARKRAELQRAGQVR